MDSNEPEDEKERRDEVNALAKYSGLAFQMVAIIGVFAFAGYKIDAAAGHSVKWVTAAMSLVGVFIALYIVIKSIKS